jgi:TonB-linked SusC/RagA family outer membrane protein
MKLLTRKLFLLVVFMFAFGLAKSEKINEIKLTLKYIKTPTLEILDEITDRTGFTFLYKKSDFNETKKISINIKNSSVKKIVDIIAKLHKVNYRQTGDEIVFEKLNVSKTKLVLKGVVKDEIGEPLPGVNITIEGTVVGTVSDVDGNFDLNVPNKHIGKNLIIQSIGYKQIKEEVLASKNFDIQLEEETVNVDEVVVVAFSKQKKESVLASISTVDVADLKVPSSNLTTAIAGRMSGVISYQRSGEPGDDDADFFIRGVTTFGYKKEPLILIDGAELTKTDLSRLNTDDIASFSIMKDATATALYGARGANGVILVTTKEGKEGKIKVNARYEHSWSMPTKDVELADPITYMNLHNEAMLSRNPFAGEMYSVSKIENTKLGTNPYVYPQTNWKDELFKDFIENDRFNFNVSGGGKIARYYVAASYTRDNGLLSVPNINDFNNNIDFKKYLLRSNININLTNTTEIVFRFQAGVDDYTGPISGGSAIYEMSMKANPVLFPAYYEADEANKYKDRILFGNYDDGNYLNPYAELVKGYKEKSASRILAQFEVKQDLSSILEGLNARMMFNMNRKSEFSIVREYKPFYYKIDMYDNFANTYTLQTLNQEIGTDYLGYSESGDKIDNVYYGEFAISYNNKFADKHGISGMLVGTIRDKTTSNPGTLEKSLPYRNIGVSGRFTYSYDDRYFTEFNFGYNGSERFDESNRFGFFPSVGVGYILTNEKFWNVKSIDKLKFKATYGLVGNDAIGSADDRFYYMSNVDMSAGGYVFGKNIDYSRSGVEIKRYQNTDVSWETAYKTNIGVELGLFNMIEIEADVFHELRTNILMSRASIPVSMGLEAAVKANLGEAVGKGFDMSVRANKYFNNGLWLSLIGNFTYAVSEFKYREEPDYSETPWLSYVGNSLKQSYGYIAERLFYDEEDIYNSPTQTFGPYMPGDIKYKDINGDGQITTMDKVPLGHPTDPEIVYGAGLTMGYEDFDFSCFFQGSARSSFWIDYKKTAPFIHYNDDNDKVPDGKVVNQAMLQAYADDYWSETNKNPYALYPRLSDTYNSNNGQKSTWFMCDGSFIRLKSVEIGYSLPKTLINKFKLDKLRIYLSGSNLYTWSAFDLWDPENASNGLAYPNQRVLNVGLQVNF